MPISRARNSISLVWLALGMFLVLIAVFLALPFGTIEAVGSLYLGLLGISMLATGSLVRWRSPRRWPRLLAIWAALAATALGVAQSIRTWPQPLTAANVAMVLTSIVVLLLAWFCIAYFAGTRTSTTPTGAVQTQPTRTTQPTPNRPQSW